MGKYVVSFWVKSEKSVEFSAKDYEDALVKGEKIAMETPFAEYGFNSDTFDYEIEEL